MKLTHSAVGLTPFRRELNFSHYTFAVRKASSKRRATAVPNSYEIVISI